MEEIINKIIDIDKETNSVRTELEELIEKKELELKETLYSLEKESSIKTKTASEKIYEQIINDGEAEVKRLKNKDIELLDKIDHGYHSQKIGLTEKVFGNLFLTEE